MRDKLALRSEAPTLDLLIDVATRHYLHGSSQIEIARDLSLDPSTISRYLKRARDEGIVRIEIVAPRRANAGLARHLAGSSVSAACSLPSSGGARRRPERGRVRGGPVHRRSAPPRDADRHRLGRDAGGRDPSPRPGDGRRAQCRPVGGWTGRGAARHPGSRVGAPDHRALSEQPRHLSPRAVDRRLGRDPRRIPGRPLGASRARGRRALRGRPGRDR